jgi:ABC-type transporter Mla MlaB component
VLRISRVTAAGPQVALKVEGDLMGVWVPLLEAECLSHLKARKQVEVDFAGVGFIDRHGVAMVHDLFARGVQVVRATALVSTLLGRSSTP